MRLIELSKTELQYRLLDAIADNPGLKLRSYICISRDGVTTYEAVLS